jgi:hypothetical protein
MDKRIVEIDMSDGIIAHLTKERGGSVHDRHVVDIRSGSFEKETYGLIHARVHMAASPVVLRRRMQLIGKPIHLSFQLAAEREKIPRTLGPIKCATILRR